MNWTLLSRRIKWTLSWKLGLCSKASGPIQGPSDFLLRSSGAVRISSEDRRHILKTHEAPPHQQTHARRRHFSERGHAGVRRHFLGEAILGAKTHGRPKTLSQNTAVAKTLH